MSFLGVSKREAEAKATPTPARKVARLISAETAKSRLQLADGKLPELQLQEGNVKEKKDKKEDKSQSVNPLVLFFALAISVGFSVLLVMVDFDQPTNSNVNKKRNVRAQIKNEFFADHDMRTNPDLAAPLKPYQQLLREAHLAHSRRDYATERTCYRKVLNLLRAERETFARGLTGSMARDRKLEEHISVLLER